MAKHYHLISYSAGEELINRLTHGFAAILSLAGLVIMVVVTGRTGDSYRIVSASVFCGTLSLFYVISTLYHTFREPRVRYIFRILDHAGIFLVIAGSYTPFTLVSLREGNGWVLFYVVWGLALSGAIFKSFMTHRLAFLAPVFYIGMGWLIVVEFEALMNTVSLDGVVWLVAGGLFYSFGIIFYAIDRIPYNHAIWHVFVMAGSACHYLAVLWYVLPLK